MKAAILSIGNEILEGSIVDTNSNHISKTLLPLGIKVEEIRAVADDLNTMPIIFREAMTKYDIVFTTGGLGPTFDDLTAEAAAEAVFVELQYYDEVFQRIKEILSSRGVEPRESHRRQAMLPKDAVLFPNGRGTAVGFGVAYKKDDGTVSHLFAMPGVPYEMTYMLKNEIIPFIKNNYFLREKFANDIRFAGLPESDVDEVLLSLNTPEELEKIINVSNGEIIVRFRSFDKDMLAHYTDKIIAPFKKNFVGINKESLESVAVKLLLEGNLSISFAESCTGGLISKKITDIAGASKVFNGSVVAYSNEAKINLLNVSSITIEKYGAVSKETVEEMARGAVAVFESDIGISVTGIAGPDGGSEEKPVGLVYIGLCFNGIVNSFKYNFAGDRNAIRERSAKAALSIVNRYLLNRA